MNELQVIQNKIMTHAINADQTTINHGMSWYEQAHYEALSLSLASGYSLRQCVGVLAALSPNNKWERNKIDAANFLAVPSLDTKVCTFMNQRKKALAILLVDTDEAIEKILNGDKTRNFYNNILYFDSSKRVTVDMWAYRSVNLEPKKKFYRLVESAYSNVAKDLEMLPHQLQAIVWGVVRGSLV